MLNSLTRADQVRLSRYAALSVCALAALACLWLLVRLLWLVLAPGASKIDIAPLPAPASTAAPLSVAKWHLFGNPQNVAMMRLTHNAPTTTLRLTLRGTWSLDDPHEGLAMIEDEHGSEHAYKIGEEVTAAAKLVAVYPDRVVLNHEGVEETLRLPIAAAVAPPLPAANRRNLVNGQSGHASSIPPTFVPPSMAHGGIDWSRAQKQLQIDPAELARQVHVAPVFENGKIAGARLSGGGRVAELMQQAGLKPTDLITAVNGTTLSSLSNPQELMDNLKDASSLQVTVMRDGKPATLTLNLH